MNNCCQIEGKKTCPHSQYSCQRSLTPDNKIDSKVDRCLSDIAVTWTPIFEWYVVRCGSKNGHQKGIMCFKEIGLHAPNVLTILGSIVNIIIRKTYMIME